MDDSLVTGIVSIALGILGVATLAVILSKNANTSGVISAGGSALSQNIAAAVSPITGGSGLSMPNFSTSIAG
jgi:hypothetical protein